MYQVVGREKWGSGLGRGQDLVCEAIDIRDLWGKVLGIPTLLSFSQTQTRPKNSKHYDPDPGPTFCPDRTETVYHQP